MGVAIPKHHQPAGDPVAMDEPDYDADRGQDEQQGLGDSHVLG